jgi:hypothetical protein
MTTFYLWLSGALYAAFAIWCTVEPEQTARAAGFLELAPGGRSEYFVIYGGLQLGLAACFCYCAANNLHRLGLMFALAITVPIVVYRLISLIRHWPVANTTVWLAALEGVLLVAAVALWVWRRP